MATDLQPLLPWMNPDNFPEAPDSAPCGYRKKKKVIPCSPEELKEAIRADKNKAIALVWIGTGGHMLVPVEVPWLLEDLIKRQRLFLRQHAAMNIMNTVVWGFAAGGLFGLLVVRTHAVTIPDRNPPWWIPASVVSWGVIFATTALCLCKFF